MNTTTITISMQSGEVSSVRIETGGGAQYDFPKYVEQPYVASNPEPESPTLPSSSLREVNYDESNPEPVEMYSRIPKTRKRKHAKSNRKNRK